MTVERDILSESSRALREITAEEEAGHRFTRARVMASLHQGKVRRRTRLAFVLPLAASFVAASAWGVSSGKAQSFFRSVGESIGILPGPPPAEEPDVKSRKGSRAVTPAPAKPVEEKASEIAPPEEAPVEEKASEEKASEEKASDVAPVEPAPLVAPEKASPRASSSAVTSPAPVTSAPDPELELYRAAHRAHFQDQDTLRALGAWNAYLEQNPNGRFALEARYNRALCLVRLGRKDEARAALSPFANGSFGGYREREARELIEALSK
jgi:type IV secretory pathway VirB10-like protein